MATAEGKVLIVRHGKGRGRLPNYFGEGLAFLARYRPEVHARLAFHETGKPAPALDDTCAVVFWLGDPLREMYPECYADAKVIADAARERGIRMINPPDALSNSIKTRQSRLWRDAKVVTPEAMPFTNMEELEKILAGIDSAMIVRPDQLHAQAGIHICNSAEDARKAAKVLLPTPSMVARIVDVRASWKAKDPDSVYAQLFHKKRTFILGPVIKSGHVFFSSSPIVATQTCSFQADRRKTVGLPPRPQPGTLDSRCIAEDNDFGNGKPEFAEALVRAGRHLGLEYFAADYSVLADGRMVLWEANPHFFLPPIATSMLAEERQSLRRYSAIFQAMGAFLHWLMEGRPK